MGGCLQRAPVDVLRVCSGRAVVFLQAQDTVDPPGKFPHIGGGLSMVLDYQPLAATPSTALVSLQVLAPAACMHAWIHCEEEACELHAPRRPCVRSGRLQAFNCFRGVGAEGR